MVWGVTWLAETQVSADKRISTTSENRKQPVFSLCVPLFCLYNHLHVLCVVACYYVRAVLLRLATFLPCSFSSRFSYVCSSAHFTCDELDCHLHSLPGFASHISLCVCLSVLLILFRPLPSSCQRFLSPSALFSISSLLLFSCPQP